MGIRDRRVLMIIKAMLKAGIMNELKENPTGTPQGGIISPLLANVYLNTLDQWIVREWENKKTKHKYSNESNKRRMLKKTKVKPAYLVRYADDWILITNTKSNAEKWKKRIAKYLKTNLKLKLSEEKTLITNARKKPIKFLGFDLKTVPGKARKGYVTRTRPNPEKLQTKVKQIHKEIKKLKRVLDKNQLIHQINLINSKIRGICQYYQPATWVNIELTKYADKLKYTAYKALKPHGGKWIPANQVNNLISVHKKYTTQIPAIEHNNVKIGITSLSFTKWKKTQLKNQEETPYTAKGREIYNKRTSKKQPKARADDLLSLHLSKLIADGLTSKLYNFEYFLNRAYAFNRDKGKCKVCGSSVNNLNVHIHHIQPKLPMDKVNKVSNLATMHEECHKLIHSKQELTGLAKRIRNKILKFREKLAEPVTVV